MKVDLLVIGCIVPDLLIVLISLSVSNFARILVSILAATAIPYFL